MGISANICQRDYRHCPGATVGAWCVIHRHRPFAAVSVQAAQLVRRHVAQIPDIQVCLAPEVSRGSGQAMPGTVWLAEDDRAIYAAPAAIWPADRNVALLHEMLHQVALGQGLQAEQLPDEEGLVEAVTHDLRPRWLRMQTGRDQRVTIAYRSHVTAVRRASAQATEARWTSSVARAWRIRTLATPPGARPGMLP